jgi:hypothetical protein
MKFLCTVLLLVFAVSLQAFDIPDKLPPPDNKKPDTKKPIKVFILSGQSNMCGMGTLGSLTKVVKEKKMFQNLLDEKGNWTVRKDVQYLYNLKKRNKSKRACDLSIKANGTHIGPELQFGHYMGYIHGEVVLVIKACCGNRSLAYDVLPPSMREGKESNPAWPIGCEYDKWFKKYCQYVLRNLDKVYMDYNDQGYEIAGFGWWQGHKDISAPQDYEKNMVAFIKDIRKEFKAPNAPFVVATIAFGGKNMAGNALKVHDAQMAVSDPKKHPEFKGNVATVDCRPFYRGGGSHYGGNAETYMLVGEGMGKAMAELIKGQQKK